MSRALIFDAHLDLSMNAIEWNRDLTQSLETIRRRESGCHDKLDRGKGVVCFPEMRRGSVGICIATQIARYAYEGHTEPGWHSREIAWAVTQAQLAWYRAMERIGELQSISTKTDLTRSIAQWQRAVEPEETEPGGSPARPIGYVLSLEGADSILSADCLEQSYRDGLRAIGPAHYGPGVYAPGTGADGPLTPEGRSLLRDMQQLGMALDVTHLTDEGFWEALERFDGPIWASHSNCRALVPDQRQLTDEQIKALAERDAVIGVVFDAWMLSPGWVRGKTTPEEAGVTIEAAADHVDHVCQLLGTTRHTGIGSDLDGGFGREQSPLDMTSIADLQRLLDILEARGYSESDVEGIAHANWLRMIERALP